MHTCKLHKETSLSKYSQRLTSGSTDNIIYLQFPSFSGQNCLAHGVFTRQGGVSDHPYYSLNTCYNIGDRPERVKKNLRIIEEAMGAENLIFMNQVHGGDIIILRRKDNPVLETAPYADAMITDIPYIALMIKQADCQGVILYDPVKAVIAVVHCGWRGNVRNILGSVIDRMRSDFECKETDILAAIGPSLGPCCAEFTSYQDIFPDKFRQFIVRDNHFNFWEISRGQLLDAGLAEDRIEVAKICTRCNTDRFYSYRAEKITGRFATVAMLREIEKKPGL
ncbi:peptidoglycan editing factor PgeF [Deltaproteobacteria bacterium]|nr:peptidoglycan editing factor PgeF [Deltaproteobacteria bacterium]